MVTTDTTKTYLSGITPSSSKGLHLGNYFGAVKQHVDFQSKGQCLYFIADYHALNTVFDPKQFAANVRSTFLDYLALGVDPSKTIFYIESDVPQITELTEILSNVISYGHMKRMHAFKDKLAEGADVESINMGLFNYPVLMAADILLFNPDYIPVGEDQSQHVEVARDIAQAFNARYGNHIKVPELYIKKGVARVLGTDGKRKMSKSLGNDITLFADETTVTKQIMGIITDENRIHATDPGDPAKNVAFSYMELLGFDQAKLADFKDRYSQGTVGDVEIKKALLAHFLEYFAPFRKFRHELELDTDLVNEIRTQGKLKAQAIAETNIQHLRDVVGIGLF